MQLCFLLLYFGLPIFLVNQLNASQLSGVQEITDTRKIEVLKDAELELRNRVSKLEDNYKSEQEKVTSLGSLYTDQLTEISSIKDNIKFFLNKHADLDKELLRINNVLKNFEKTNKSVEVDSLKLSELQKKVDRFCDQLQALDLFEQRLSRNLDDTNVKLSDLEKKIKTFNENDILSKETISNKTDSLDKDLLNDLKKRVVSLRWTMGALCFFNLMFVVMLFYMNLKIK